VESGGQPGNQNAVKAKRWQKALERGLARFAEGSVDDGLDKVADHVVKAAVGGDKDAWKEIGDRMDGKAVQSIAGDPEQPLVHKIVREIVDSPAS
jgi:hypothetical protein